MTKDELEKEYYGRRPTEPYSEDDSPNDWANIVQYAEENLDKAFKAIAELEKEKCELLGIIQGKDKVIQELEKENEELRNIAEFQQSSNMNRYFVNKKLKDENAELKEKLDKIRKYLVYDIFDRFNSLENLLKISQGKQEELFKRILEQLKTIGSLPDMIDELKAHCKAVDEVNEKMKCCGNCGFGIHNRLDGTFCGREAEYRQANEKCNKWESAE
jgi:chromosome segregation ATPase